jgi:excisionase family DNA binding protein
MHGGTMEKQKLGYSLNEAAEASSLSRRTLEYLIEQGKLKALKVNARTVIPARALEKLIETGTGMEA